MCVSIFTWICDFLAGILSCFKDVVCCDDSSSEKRDTDSEPDKADHGSGAGTELGGGKSSTYRVPSPPRDSPPPPGSSGNETVNWAKVSVSAELLLNKLQDKLALMPLDNNRKAREDEQTEIEESKQKIAEFKQRARIQARSQGKQTYEEFEKELAEAVADKTLLKEEVELIVKKLRIVVKNKKEEVELEKEETELRSKTEALQKKTDALQKELEAQQAEISSVKEQLAAADEQLRAENEILATLEQALQNAQEKEKIEPAEDDAVVQIKFMRLWERVQNWTQLWRGPNIYLLQKMDEEPRSPKFELVLEDLRNVVRTDIAPPPNYHEESGPNTTRFILSAHLANTICRQVFEKPFVLMEYKTNEENVSESIDTLYASFTRTKEGDGHEWRRKTLTLLDPPRPEGSEYVIEAFGRASKRRKMAAQAVSNNFLNSPAAKFCMKPATAEEAKRRHHTLVEIFQEALEMSSRLWRQKTMLKCHRLDESPENLFHLDSRIMEAHPLHGIVSGVDNAERLEDVPVRVLLHPAVLAYGRDDGTHYERYKVWSKALVLMDDERILDTI